MRLLLALLFVVSALFLVKLTLRQLRLIHRLRQTGVEVVGTVLRQRKVSTKNGPRYVPTIRFTTLMGQAVEQEHNPLTLRRLDFFDGDEVALRYHPDEPARFLLVQELTDAGPYVMTVVVALVVLGAVHALKGALAALTGGQ